MLASDMITLKDNNAVWRKDRNTVMGERELILRDRKKGNKNRDR